jgi:YVTN family beta-propeller protein
VIDAGSNTVIATIPAGFQSGPRAVATTRDGKRAYVTNFLSNSVLVIDTTSNAVVNVIPLGGGPNWVTIPR